MTKIELLNDSVDLSKQQEVDKIAAIVVKQGDCRLLVLSPMLSFFPSKDYNESTMRSKLKPLLDLAACRT